MPRARSAPQSPVNAPAAAPAPAARRKRAARSAALPATMTVEAPPGWSDARVGGMAWTPRFDGADQRLLRQFADAKGQVVIVEIKVARADLLGDAKWPDYLDFCDRFYWGVPPGLDRTPLETEAYRPATCGVIVADGYDAEILRPAALEPLAAARRKTQVEHLARIAMRRHMALLDPLATALDSHG